MALAEPDDVVLLKGCYLEAQRSDDIALKLEGLRIALNEPSHSCLANTIKEICRVARRLRELGDLAHVNRDRLGFALDPLNLALPCLSKTLRDIKVHYDDRSKSKQNRWRHMFHSMQREAGGLQLEARFTIYHQFIIMLRDMIVRCPNFDVAKWETLKLQIHGLRNARGIDRPDAVQAGPLVQQGGFIPPLDPISHWAEHVFHPKYTPRVALRNVGQTESLGPHRELGHHNIPMHSKVLFRRSFDGDKISLVAFLNSQDEDVYLLLRIFKDNQPWFSMRGVHELCIQRHRSSLELRRWSTTSDRSKIWATLCFNAWEDLVLMYCTFISLKARARRTIQCSPKELSLGGEHKLFQACITDDGYDHSLIVYQDRATGAFRLHAAVWDGELRQCPVWTAFVTDQIMNPNWLRRVSPHKVRLTDLRLFVFCKRYREYRQRKGPAGDFQINFVSDLAAPNFEEVFYPTQPRVQ